MSDSQFDIAHRGAENITKAFSKRVEKYAKPYMRHLTAEILGAGVPSQYMQYAFRIVFEGRRGWKVPPKYKSAIFAMNRVVIDKLLVPNYNRNAIADKDYSANMNEALVETGKWVLTQLAKNLQNDYNKIAGKQAKLAVREMPDLSYNEWLEEYKDLISHLSSLYLGGTRTANILNAILH